MHLKANASGQRRDDFKECDRRRLQGSVIKFEMNTLYQGSEVDAGIADWKRMNHRPFNSFVMWTRTDVVVLNDSGLQLVEGLTSALASRPVLLHSVSGCGGFPPQLNPRSLRLDRSIHDV